MVDLGDLREVFSQLQRLVAFQAVSAGPINARVASEVVHGRLSAPFRDNEEKEKSPLRWFIIELQVVCQLLRLRQRSAFWRKAANLCLGW